jgi:hypothetical protein
MDQVKLLKGADGEFAVDLASKWSPMILRSEGQEWKLGHDSPRVILQRIFSFVEGRGKLPEWNGQGKAPWKWVLTLSEPHCSFYGVKTGSGFLLMAEDAHGKPLRTVKLTPADADRWEVELREWLNLKPDQS